MRGHESVFVILSLIGVTNHIRLTNVDFITQLFLGVDDKVRREIDKPSAYS